MDQIASFWHKLFDIFQFVKIENTLRYTLEFVFWICEKHYFFDRLNQMRPTLVFESPTRAGFSLLCVLSYLAVLALKSGTESDFQLSC